jgi:hypothetical protein
MKTMVMAEPKRAAAVLAAYLLFAGTGWRTDLARADEPLGPRPPGQAGPISVQQFEEALKVIRPLAGEYAWRDEIPWLGRLQAARERAVAEDKPILIMASANAYAGGRT